MIAFLNPLKNSIWIKIISLSLFSSLFSITVWIFLTFFLTINDIVAIFITLIITIPLAAIVGLIIASDAIIATNYLADAILLATSDNKQLQAPNDNDLQASKEFLSKLASNVYDLTSAAVDRTQSSDSELPFYRSMVNNIPLPIIALDKNRRIIFANNMALQYIKLPASDVMDKFFYDCLDLSFVSDLTLDSWLDNVPNHAAVKNQIWSRVRLNFADDTRKQFDMVAHYSNNDPNNLETIIVLLDRTVDYDRDDHDLTFIALAVHELRTPMAIMRGYIEVFEDELTKSLNSEQVSFMHNMSASSQQLTSYVSNILNVARVEENALTLKIKEENWQDVLMVAGKDMQLRATVHGKKLVFDIANNLPTVAVDKISIYEVVTNLVDNAIKYTHTDDDILIKSYTKDNMVETTVTDKGVGISAIQLDHIFDKFYRGYQSKNSTSGTGLGLYLSRAIIMAQGGTIWVNSTEGKGSTFGFSVPTYASVADQIKNEDNKGIVRGAHGWIKNHSLYRE